MKNWQTITVGEYQYLMKIIHSDMDEFEKEIQVCACLKGCTPTDIEAMTFGGFIDLKKEISWIFSDPPKAKPVRKWKRYKFIYDIRKINTGRYASIQFFLQAGLVDNLHNLAATIIKPRWRRYDATRHEDYAEDIKDAPFLSVYSGLVFFCRLFIEFIRVNLDRIAEPKMKETLIYLRHNLDGLFMLNDLQNTSDAH